jgi:hypothetical protein
MRRARDLVGTAAAFPRIARVKPALSAPFRATAHRKILANRRVAKLGLEAKLGDAPLPGKREDAAADECYTFRTADSYIVFYRKLRP